MIPDSALIKRIENIQLTLQEEMKKSEHGLCEKSIQQLKTIYDELEYMKSKKGFKPAFPRFRCCGTYEDFYAVGLLAV